MVLKSLNLRLSIRTRFFVLLLLLTILPFLAYRFAIDLNRIMLTNQAIIQQQTAKNLSLILENRPDLWALQIQAGTPTQLPHLNLSNSVLWVVNAYGKTTYVVGQLPELKEPSVGFFTLVGKTLIKTLATFIPYSLPYPYPQSKTPELNLIQSAFQGQTIQQYRMDDKNRPISLMAATPLRFNNRVIGTLVLEERMETLFSASLNYFYRMVGIGSIVFLIVIIGAIIHTASLSNRILRLDNDVKKMFNFKGRLTDLGFPDKMMNMYYEDELSDLRHHIHEMLKQLAAYERYLKQLPKTLRHELHNPMNRLAMALSLLENDVQHIQLGYAKHALAQLKSIIAALSEATSIEDSLKIQTPEPFPIGVMLSHYMQNNIDLHPEWGLKYVNHALSEETMVLGDGFMIEQLMDKLISNAKDFSDHQIPITVTAELNDQQVIIRIENSGTLLPEGYEQHIFEGMTSIRTLNQDEHAHLGLGLYIAKLITDYHHGQIYAENFYEYHKQPIEGVRFTVELPAFKEKAELS